jgi:glycosyltransferase involved in cell wall biosynthesis
MDYITSIGMRYRHCDRPSLAVIIPCWNAENWVARAVRSILDQQYPALELIVIDDGSTDRSLGVVASIDGPIRCESGPNRGSCAARNRGLQITRAEYVLFLDADDYLEPGSLDAWGRCAVRTNADIVFGRFAYEQHGQRALARPAGPPLTPQNLLRQWLDGWFTPPCAILWRQSFVRAIGGWNSTASRNQDGELAMRALLHQPRVAMANAGLGVYVQHDAPNRVSRRAGLSVFASELTSLINLWETAKARGHQDSQPSFARAFYRIAYTAYAGGIAQVGDDALSWARKLGLRGHIGSPIHRVSSALLGLRIKLAVSAFLKRRAAL